MHKFKQMRIKPMVFKNMSSNFLGYIRYLNGHNEIYQVLPFDHAVWEKKKAMIRFAKLIRPGGLSCHRTFPKTRFCVYPRFSPSFPSAEVPGGRAARAAAFPSRSNSDPALPRGEPPISTRFWKRLPAKQKKKNEGNIFPRPFVRHARQSAGSVASVKGKALRAASRP